VLTYVFTPTYGRPELEDVDCIFPLDHVCLQPSGAQLGSLQESRRVKNAPYQMVHIIDSSNSYGFLDTPDDDDEDGDDGKDKDNRNTINEEDANGEETKNGIEMPTRMTVSSRANGQAGSEYYQHQL
jgi:hypothetical protein